MARQRRRSRCLRAAAPRRGVAPKRWFARRYPSHEAQVLRGAVLRCVRTGEAPAVRLACAASAHATRTSSTNMSLRLEISASRVRPRWLRCAAPQHAPRPLVQEGVRFLAASRRCSAVLSAAASTSPAGTTIKVVISAGRPSPKLSKPRLLILVTKRSNAGGVDGSEFDHDYGASDGL